MKFVDLPRDKIRPVADHVTLGSRMRLGDAYHLRYYAVILLSLLLCGCMSPYGPTYLPVFSWIKWTLVEYDEVNIQIDEKAPEQSSCKRDAILLTAAKIALQHNYSYFDFTKDPRIAKESLNHILNGREKSFSVFLCRGVCPTMYSAISISHLLSHRFNFVDSAESEDPTANKCL